MHRKITSMKRLLYFFKKKQFCFCFLRINILNINANQVTSLQPTSLQPEKGKDVIKLYLAVLEIRGHPLGTYAKFSEKLIFLTP